MQCSGQLNYDNTKVPLQTIKKTNRHPCYSFEAHHKYARMHLPVAPQCNISCNYCNRKFDCVNESRPGVTSKILTPEEAYLRFVTVKEKLDNLSVVGIAGPGDALANWEDTRRTMELIRAVDREIIFCLSTNGLMLPQLAGELVDLGLEHVTVTVNCLDPKIGARIYRHVSYRGRNYSGVEGAEILIANQLEGIRSLAEKGVLVKVNTVMVEGINDHHIQELVKKVRDLGAFICNIMPLIPASGSIFENYPRTDGKKIAVTREICQVDLQQMTHCKQCRADAIGMLGSDCSNEFIPERKKCSFKREAV